ncbi:guanidino acid hydrolase, mitochondrial isoform X3 [Microcaecilia unicolor]|uniref:Agmatinase, mitochondrial isoform X3 n=1 Tax=Microcaecilia unicolor TaxID=1415580 RepID=A0A6P7WL67_9AMPH|nr:agmatinase, mitochondrial isoform X3 [Microcaecilia unicolor]
MAALITPFKSRLCSFPGRFLTASPHLALKRQPWLSSSTSSSSRDGGRGTSASLFPTAHYPPAHLLPRSRKLFLQSWVNNQPVPQRWASHGPFNMPPCADDTAGMAGICSMMKLPIQDSAEGLDAAFVGVPLDTGTSNRPGARFGPRSIRAESILVRSHNSITGAAPFRSINVADVGDVNVNLYDLKDSCKRIREAYQKIMAVNCTPLTLGGDHTITYPILQAVAEKHGPVGLVHIDAHTDTGDKALGEKIYHGTPFRRCVDEGLLDCKRVVQIGIRGSSYQPDPYKFNRHQGFRVVPAEDCWFKSLVPLMSEVRQQMGEKPVYISFDIDGLDPAYAPGTGTPEIAGLTPSQALEIIRGCQGLNIVGCDLVEVAPMYDASGNTALIAANMLFEMLCVLPGVKCF